MLVADISDKGRSGSQSGLGWRAAWRPREPLAQQRALLESNTADAGKSQMGVDPLDNQRGEMLQFERKSTFDPNDEGRRLEPALRPCAAARRPAQAQGFRHRCEPGSDDLVPKQNNVRLAKALPDDDRIDRGADEIGERTGSRGAPARMKVAHAIFIDREAQPAKARASQ